MKKILIIGDSMAGINSYAKNAFNSLNYNVLNIHFGGINDLFLLQIVENKLIELKINEIENILWFHSDLGRIYRDYKGSFNTNIPFTIQEFYDELGKLSYKKFENLRKKTTGKVIVIGGSGSVLDNFKEYSNADMLISDWRYELLNLQLPPLNGLDGHINVQLVDTNKNLIMSEKQKFEYMNNQKILTDAMKNSEIFFDDWHVCEKYYIDLAKKIDIIIQK